MSMFTEGSNGNREPRNNIASLDIAIFLLLFVALTLVIFATGGEALGFITIN